MSTKTIISILASSFVFISCAAVSENQSSEISNSTIEQGRLLRQPVPVNESNEELSCLEECGQEARQVVYANCLEESGEQQNCAITGREWYRDCLVDLCDEAAVELDDCRTECRLSGKRDYGECVAQTEDSEGCRENRINTVQTCIAECN